MNFSTKHSIALCVAFSILSSIGMSAQPAVTQPTVKSRTSFAIIIDKGTNEALSDKVLAYRDAIEKDGLATYIVTDDFKIPEQVKEQIAILRNNSKMPLEGVVFIGEIPIVMTRDAQHLASAFKMDQNRPWQQSSIPSDRYYDDFDLKFDFIRQDEKNPLYFYYSLSKDSPQYIRSDIYSARVRAGGEDALKKIGTFLDKAVAAHAENNALDRMFVFTGHGYNSESTDSWSGEHIMLREQLPGMFAQGSLIRFARAETVFPLKNYLLEMLRDESMDIVMGHHHGAPGKQYLNGYKTPVSVADCAEHIKRYLRTKVAAADDKEKTMQMFMKDFDVPASWFDLSDSTATADEKFDYMLDIHLKDIYDARPCCRFVMLDACFNGSFHLDDCIADAYIFSEGRTVAVQGNSVNSLQDRLPDRYIGALAMGVSIGQWARLNQTVLDTHIVGDPTYHFTNTAYHSADIPYLMSSCNAKAWAKLLKCSDTPAEIKTISLRILRDAGYKDNRSIINDTFYSSPECIVREECLNLMSDIPGETFKKMVIAGLNDSHERIRRMSADYLVRMGDEDLAKVAVDAMLDNKFSKRVSFHLRDAVDQMEPSFMKKALQEKLGSRSYSMEGTMQSFDDYLKKIDYTQNRLRYDFDNVIVNPEANIRKRLSEIRIYRNYHHHVMIPELIAVAKDKNQDETIRQAIVEALGWFRFSYRTPEIIDMCNGMIADTEEVESIRNEAAKTIVCLSAY